MANIKKNAISAENLSVDASVDIDANVATAIYVMLEKNFKGDAFRFTLEYPSKVLNQLDYAYPIVDSNSSTLAKPYSVVESEFRLCDFMLGDVDIVQGNSGEYVSTAYQAALNNLIPKIEDLKDFVIDKMDLRAFLLEKITDRLNGAEITCTRLEFCQRTYLNYLEKKYAWDQEKIAKQKEFTSKNALDDYAKWLATTSWTKDHELQTLFNDAIIRGFYHEIMTILGFMDVESPAERLYKAKLNRNTSIRRSLDGTRDILPVQFTPSNWFRALSSNFTLKDLSMDVTYLGAIYEQKRQQMTNYETELRILVMRDIGVDSTESLKKQVLELKKALDDDEKVYLKSFTSAQIDCIKLAFEIVAKGKMAGFIAKGNANAVTSLAKLFEDENIKKLFGISGNVTPSNDSSPSKCGIEKLIDSIFSLYSSHIDYFNSYEQLTEVELQLAKSYTNNYNDRIEILKEKIFLLQQELTEISLILVGGAVNDSTAPASTVLPDKKDDLDSFFTDIILSKEMMSSEKNEADKQKYASIQGSMKQFFVNSTTSVEYSASSSKFVQELYNSNFEISMRVMKVSVDRGGWFDVGIFKNSKDYMRISNVEANQKFPIYPTSFLIAKDVIIKSSNLKSSKENYEEFQKLLVNHSTNLFGFKISGSYGSQSYMKGDFEKEEGQTFVLKIPSPQIMGWFQERIPKDESSPYQSLAKSSYFKDIMESIKMMRSDLNSSNNNNTFTTIEF